VPQSSEINLEVPITGAQWTNYGDWPGFE